jgi:hypothetical protein
MLDINTFILILSSCLDATTLGRLRIIVLALLSMSGRVTMRGISRWAEGGDVIARFNASSIHRLTGTKSTGFWFAIIFLKKKIIQSL